MGNDKLKEANENIEELIDIIVDNIIVRNNGNCLTVVLFGLDRDCKDKSCSECNHISLLRYKEKMLKRYIVK
jgi:hypothetical protein